MPLDVEHVISQLTPSEKLSLLAGTDWWHTKAIPRLKVPALRVTDGPNGVRGTRFFNGVPAACFPCGTALGATFNVELLEQAGKLMAEESKAKGAQVILGPTINMQRSPLGGRGFESFSEDPVLAGQAAAAVVRGMQAEGIAATIKHFVCNDQEHERLAVNSIISQRALREIYLKPFQIVVKDSNPAAFMTAYNKVNGIHASESDFLLGAVLRGEWKWEGLVMSDWYGTYSVSEAINSGLDLEMPGPSRWRTDALTHALRSKKVLPFTLDQRVRELLKFINWTERSGVPEGAPEEGRDIPETGEFLRKVTAETIVLMKNDKDILPLSKEKTTAVVGPLAKFAAYCGGGSAMMPPYYAKTPYEGIVSLLGQDKVKYSQGVYAHKALPLMNNLLKTADGKTGYVFKAYNDPPEVKDREAADTLQLNTTNLFFADYVQPKLKDDLWWATVEADFTPDLDGDYDFGISVYGTAKLYIDGNLVVDNATKQRAGESFAGDGTAEEISTISLKAGQKYSILVDFASAPAFTLVREGVAAFGGGGVRLGMALKIDTQKEIEAAVELAKSTEQVVVCAGLNSDWESEGYDRPHMDLPQHTDALISAVLAANSNAVVVIQSGTPVTMPWLKDAPTLVHAWYGGNETGSGIADVLFGEVNPSAKLSLSFPYRNEDNPAFLNYRSERGRAVYGEDVYIGYRFYEATKREVAFPFGHGLSYTSFELSDLKASTDQKTISVSLGVENTGKVAGAEVVQVYVAQKTPSLRRPPKELKGFAKRFMEAGKKESVSVEIDFRHATSFWDEERDAWASEKGTYEILVGASSDKIVLKGEVEAQETVYWKGL